MSVSAKPLQDSEPDELVANKKAAEECGVCVKTTDRWDEDLSIGYPPPIFIYTRISIARAACSNAGSPSCWPMPSRMRG